MGSELAAKKYMVESAFLEGAGVGSVLFALILVATYVAIVRPLRQRRMFASDAATAPNTILHNLAKTSGAPSPQAEGRNTLSKAEGTPLGGEMDIKSLMSAVRDQALELRCEHEKAVSSLAFSFDLLTTRLSTIDPLVANIMEAASDHEASVGRLAVANDDIQRKLAEAERDLEFYRPLALRLENDLRSARHALQDADQKLAALEGDRGKDQGVHEELRQQATLAEAARQRAAEENNALVQKLNDYESTIQSLRREASHTKSEAVSTADYLERAERDAKSMAEKYAAEREASSKAKAALHALQTQFNQLRRESAAQLEQAKERELGLTAALSVKENQFYDADAKRTSLSSRVDYLAQSNQRLREDLRRSLDQFANLEASKRSLTDLLARNGIGENQEIETKNSATGSRPARLRAVDSQAGNGG